MPNPVRIQPIDFNASPDKVVEAVGKPILVKSRFKRLFEKQLTSVLRTDKLIEGVPDELELEPSSVCLDRMVQNFMMEESNEKSQQQRCGGRNRCNCCFNGYGTESSNDDEETEQGYVSEACDLLKRLVLCLFVSERNLLADTAKIVERNRIGMRKDRFCRNIVTDELVALGYNASICKSKWEKSPSFPAGEYEYVDVIIEGERLIIDIDFRSEFEIARSTKAYKQLLQTLPEMFVGKADRLEKIIGIVSQAANQSLKKKGMPCPPWRREGYVRAKWLSPFSRIGGPTPTLLTPTMDEFSKTRSQQEEEACIRKSVSCDNGLDLLFGEACSTVEEVNSNGRDVLISTNCNINSTTEKKGQSQTPSVKQWELPEIKPRSFLKGVKIATGLASVMED